MNYGCKCFRPDAQQCDNTGYVWQGCEQGFDCAGSGIDWVPMPTVTVTALNGCPTCSTTPTTFVIGAIIFVLSALLRAARVDCCRRVFKFEPTSPLSEPLSAGERRDVKLTRERDGRFGIGIDCGATTGSGALLYSTSAKAAAAGMVAGCRIVAADGTEVGSAEDLDGVLGNSPGSLVRRSVTFTLAAPETSARGRIASWCHKTKCALALLFLGAVLMGLGFYRYYNHDLCSASGD